MTFQHELEVNYLQFLTTSNHNSQTFLAQCWFANSCNFLSSLIMAAGMHLGSEAYPALTVPSINVVNFRCTLLPPHFHTPTAEISRTLGKALELDFKVLQSTFFHFFNFHSEFELQFKRSSVFNIDENINTSVFHSGLCQIWRQNRNTFYFQQMSTVHVINRYVTLVQHSKMNLLFTNNSALWRSQSMKKKNVLHKPGSH